MIEEQYQQALIEAILADDSFTVRRLIADERFRPDFPLEDYPGSEGTAFALACRCSSPLVAGLLWEHDADFYSETHWRTFYQLLITDNIDIIRYLLQHGWNPNYRFVWGNTPLSVARSRVTIEMLVAFGADPNSRIEENGPPLFDALKPECIHALVESGADINAQDEFNRNALDLALTFGSHEVIFALLENGIFIRKGLVDGPFDRDVLDIPFYSEILSVWRQIVQEIVDNPKRATKIKPQYPNVDFEAILLKWK